MEYSNPQLPEGINASQEHPLKEFFWLTAGVAAALLLLLLVGVVIADRLVGYIPFSIEQQMTARHLPVETTPSELGRYLNSLASRIATAEQLPEGMSVQIHYSDSDTVNAFATLGGHITLFRGLLEKVENENTLSMILAHEIAHVKHRDPIHGAGRAVVIGMTVATINAGAGDSLLNTLLSQETSATLMKFSRDQERRADDEALAALQTLYGHSEGAAELFEILMKEDHSPLTIEFFSSHPLTGERLAKTQAATGPNTDLTPLPDKFGEWLKGARDKDDSREAEH